MWPALRKPLRARPAWSPPPASGAGQLQLIAWPPASACGRGVLHERFPRAGCPACSGWLAKSFLAFVCVPAFPPRSTRHCFVRVMHMLLLFVCLLCYLSSSCQTLNPCEGGPWGNDNTFLDGLSSTTVTEIWLALRAIDHRQTLPRGTAGPAATRACETSAPQLLRVASKCILACPRAGCTSRLHCRSRALRA